MSVLVIQGPHRFTASESSSVARVLEGLSQRVANAGSMLEIVRCTSASGLVRCLRRARARDVDFVLVDGGELDALDCARHQSEIRHAIDALRAPYVEVHGRDGCDLESRIHPTHVALAILVMSRDLARSYTLAVGIAIRRLARASRTAHSTPDIVAEY